MTIGRFFSSWVGGLVGALALVALALLGWVLLAPPGAEDGAPPPQAVAVPEASELEPEARTPEARAQTQAQTPAEPEAPEAAPPQDAKVPVQPQAPTQPEAPAPLAPAFDVVRITPDGSALVAGRAEPGAAVSVLVEGAAVAQADADSGAGFVAMFDLPPLDIDRVMTLEAVLADGTRLISEMSVIVEGVALPQVVASATLAPEPEPAPASDAAPGLQAAQTGEPMTAPDQAGTAPEAAAPAPSQTPQEPAAIADPARPDAPDTTEVPATPQAPAIPQASATPQTPAISDAPATPQAPAMPESPLAPPPAAAPEAPRILLAGPDGVRVLQDTRPRAQISIDAISYDDAGDVALAGRGQGAETLRIYLDNAPVGTAQVGPGGDWRAPLPDVDAGVYTLRVDSLSADGEVTSRVETPFKREEPAVLAAAGEKAAEAVAAGRTLAAITVQPGHTLWAIAEGRYGEGIQYWTIFRANSDQIRDPDWIYPGQVFTLPDAAQ